MKTMLTLLLTFAGYLMVQAQTLLPHTWRYYTTGTTGILGDYAEALWIDHDGNPFIAAYTPGWEEGGFSKFSYQENSWENYSNVNYPEIGSIYDVGASRISDMEEDGDGVLWMATWRGILKFDPAVGGNSLAFWGANNSLHPGGRTKDIDVAPDGTIWAAVLSVVWGSGGIVHYNPFTGQWRYWGYGSTANNWPSVIGQCDHLAIQEKTGGGYMVWIDGEGWNTMITYDSDSQLFTLLPQNSMAGEVVALPGNDCVDNAGNLWALRFTSAGNNFSLDYRKPDGTWVIPSQPASVVSDIWAFKATGIQEALIVGISSEIFHFHGNVWESKGIWRDGAWTYAVDVDSSGNIWASGLEGAARRDAISGIWQRYRITNTSQLDYFIEDIAIDDQGRIWTTANGGPGVGGFQMFDGNRWTGFNQFTYGMGFPFPFPTDNAEAVCFRPSNGNIVINPMFNNLHSWNGSNYTSLSYPAVRSRGMVEDSQFRLWSIGEYYDLSYYNETANNWIAEPFIGWGSNIRRDPTRSGTVWACSGHQVLRTDGSYRYSKGVEDFPELDPQSDVFSTVIPDENGIAWLGSNKGLYRLDANTGTYQYYAPSNSGIPGEQVTPLGISPDGRIWFTNFQSVDTTRIGLCWFDGITFGVIPVQDAELPHAQISDLEVKVIEGGYELWMSCLSRGIAVLTVPTSPVGVEPAESGGQEVSMTTSPNPFASKTTITFSMEREGVVRFTIYDIFGREVAVIEPKTFPAGRNSITWAGTDVHGRKLLPGNYFVRLETGEGVASIQLVIRHSDQGR